MNLLNTEIPSQVSPKNIPSNFAKSDLGHTIRPADFKLTVLVRKRKRAARRNIRFA